MQILVTGGTGFIGEQLCERLLADSHKMILLTRQSLLDSESCRYVSDFGEIDSGERIDAVINLAGASLADRRWTRAYKDEIFASRLDTTAALLQLLGRLEHKPAVLLNGSAIGYYGHHGDEELDEAGQVTAGFSQDLCQQWEQLALTAKELGVRVCLLRLGVVLDRDGGAFPRMALPFKFGVANWMGGGRQWLSWVHRCDVVRAMLFLLEREDLEGPFNITAPRPVTSRGFCDAMKHRKQTLLSAPVPAVLLRLMVGEMAEELLLKGQRVVPAALQEAGFVFDFPKLDEALVNIL